MNILIIYVLDDYDDEGYDDVDDHVEGGDDDDIYIMMKCLCVCHEK